MFSLFRATANSRVSVPLPKKDNQRGVCLFPHKKMLEEELKTLRSMKIRDYISQFIALGIVVCSALMIWKFMMFATYSESPIVVVLSGSMEPGYQRGDLLFLTMWSSPIEVGEIVVYKLDGRDIPIVHRVHRVHVDEKNETYILTKGDNNPQDDRSLYNQGQEWIHVRNLMGRSRAYLPYVGMLTIWMTETPAFKFIVIGLLAFFVITNKEEQ